MSGFLSALNVSLVADADADHPRAIWKLNEPLVYFSDLVGHEIVVPEGFVTDFASVPRIPVVWDLAGGESNEPAALHDYLYTSHVVPRATADAVFAEAMTVTGQPWWLCKLMWAGVRLFGAAPFDEDYQPKGDSP